MQLGVIGLGVMGAALARNAAKRGACVAIYNRSCEKTEAFMKKHGSEGEFIACESLEDMTRALTPPRPILLMVKAGAAVDDVIKELTPILSKNDIVIDAGNSHYHDTERRAASMAKKGIRFIGMGVSGGEKGALEGPSMMFGGERSAYEDLQHLLEAMAAEDGNGGKCVSYIGPGGSGHFVKMVHNGIEYGLMQLIAESYHLLWYLHPGLSNAETAEKFAEWNKGDDLRSYLMEITANILRKKDPATGRDLIEVIRDGAGQKGTGQWTTASAMDLSVPVPTITAAVDARLLSSRKAERAEAAAMMRGVRVGTPSLTTEEVRTALFLSTICAYTQGMTLLRATKDAYEWNLDLGEICRIWQGGCIIRSVLLTTFARLFRRTPDLHNLITEKTIHTHFQEKRSVLARVIAKGVNAGIPLPAMSASLAYVDSLSAECRPQNLIQAQRDFFGAHGFERIDKEGVFHGDW